MRAIQLPTESVTGALREGAVDAAIGFSPALSPSLLHSPHFLALPTIIAASEMIATIPRPLAELMQPVAPMRILPVPVRLPRLLVEQFWHERFHDDAASRWLRALPQVFAAGPRGFTRAAD